MSEKKTEIRAFHNLLGKLRIRQQKEAILDGYGVTSTTDLTIEQLRHINDSLRNQQRAMKIDVPKGIRRLRSQVMTMVNQYGIYQDKNDWTAVNNFLLQPRIAGKLLYQMNEDELKALIKKMHILIKKRNKKLDELHRLQRNN